MKKTQFVLVITLLGFYTLFNQCKESSWGYSFFNVETSLKLPKELNEISGLTYVSDSVLACIQDEKAHVYYLNIITGKIISKFDFGSDRDFEGVSKVNDFFYILQSNGSIFKTKEKGSTDKFKFKDNKSFEFEGICFDPRNNRLLVACKNHSGKKKNEKYIYIYEFSLKKNKYQDKPLFKIEKSKVHKNFKSSGIAIHPNGNIFVISSMSKTLLELTPNGKVINNTQLNSYIFHQPEGITFNKKGDLFISNEKHKTYPTLLKYTYEN